MHPQSTHLDARVNHAVRELCNEIIQWERSTGRQSVLIIRENNGEMAGDKMTEPGFIFRAVNGIPLDVSSDDLTDDQILTPFRVPQPAE